MDNCRKEGIDRRTFVQSSAALFPSLTLGGSEGSQFSQKVDQNTMTRLPYSYLVYKTDGTYVGLNCKTLSETYTASTVDGVLNPINEELDGGTVLIESGHHPVANPIENMSCMTYIGEGPTFGTRFYAAESLARMIDARGARFVELRNMKIDGRDMVDVAVDMEHADSIPTRNYINRCTVRNATDLVRMTNNEDWQIAQSSLMEFTGVGIRVDASLGHGTVQRTLITYNAKSGSAAAQVKEGKVDFNGCAIEGAAKDEPSNALVEVMDHARVSFSQSWLYSEKCPNILVHDSHSRLFMFGCELYLRNGSTVDANIVQEGDWANHLSIFGGEIRNGGSGTDVLTGSFGSVGLFGTLRAGEVDVSEETQIRDLSFEF